MNKLLLLLAVILISASAFRMKNDDFVCTLSWEPTDELLDRCDGCFNGPTELEQGKSNHPDCGKIVSRCRCVLEIAKAKGIKF